MIEPLTQWVRVHLGGLILAETRAALIVRKDGQEDRIYIPRSDVDLSMTRRSSHFTESAEKGRCTYFDLPDAGARSKNAAWSYENPPANLAALKEYMTFDPRCVDWLQVES